MPGLVLLDLVRQRRARTDQRHVAAKRVDELRQLVEARLAQDAADRRYPGVVRNLEQGRGAGGLLLTAALDERVDVIAMNRLIRVRVHRPEFQHGERPAVLPHASLTKEDRTR